MNTISDGTDPIYPGNRNVFVRSQADAARAIIHNFRNITFLPLPQTQPVNCRGCGANHADDRCPYCGRFGNS